MAVIDRMNWREVAWRGALSLVVGVVVLVWRTPPLPAFTVLFATYAFVDGVLALDLALRTAQPRGRWPYLLEGAAGIAVALVSFFWPHLSLEGLLVIIGTRALILGILEMIATWGLSSSVATASLYGLGGAVAFSAGIFILQLPVVDTALLLTVFGLYALVFGALLLALGLWFRQSARGEIVGARRPVFPEAA